MYCVSASTLRDTFTSQSQKQNAFNHVKPINNKYSEENFIHVDGLQLRDNHQRPYLIRGMNYWSCINLASDVTAGGDIERLQLEMDQMAAVGINHLRIMASTQGSKTRQPFRILPALQTSPDEWDERIFVGLDRCIAEAEKRKMRLTMVLGNTWQWTGGNAQLVAWSEKNEEEEDTIPYPRSWNMSAVPQREDGYAGWGNWTKGSDSFNKFQGSFYSNLKAKEIYRRHLDKVLQRKNTITNRKYIDDPTILAWEPINEPTAASSKSEDRSNLMEWYREITRYIKTKTPKQLVTTGYESKQSQEEFNEIHNNSAVDYACAHMWPQIWNKYDMLDSSKDNLERAIEWSEKYLLNVQSYARSIGKPILLEEIGMPRDNWQNTDNPKKYLYDTAATTTSRDALIKATINLIVTQHGKSQGLIGTALWSYGGTYRSLDQKYNNHGILIAGDPPQEPPGWHSILNTDNTMQLMLDMKIEEDDIVKYVSKH